VVTPILQAGKGILTHATLTSRTFTGGSGLKRTSKALERVTVDPWRIGAIAAAALVLLHLQRPAG
jgi:hypothetical protein